MSILLIGCSSYIASIDFPSMPEMSSPSMPQIGTTPYGQNPYRPIRRPPAPTPTQETTSEQTEQIEQSSIPKSAAGMALSAQNISDLGGLSALSGLGSKKDLLSNISSLSSIKGDESLSEVLQTLSNKDSTKNTTTDSTNTMLTQILEQLQVLSEKQNKKTEENTTSIQTSKESSSKILRFNVTGFDVLSTCKTIYFSEPEPNGVFLLTGDRNFFINEQNHTETFYFLFKPKPSENGSFFYDVETDLIQSPETTGSKLYPLSENVKISARRTGNLVSLRYSQENWNIDILLDLKEHK